MRLRPSGSASPNTRPASALLVATTAVSFSAAGAQPAAVNRAAAAAAIGSGMSLAGSSVRAPICAIAEAASAVSSHNGNSVVIQRSATAGDTTAFSGP